ncbi:aspartate/glutamate racemase family protein [Kineococcus indalonis]|uniref:aspartate/glutamate racemase family protein n=1 Tax=Kineococcus indalonis TaxID=2696566 RepID=UPI0014123E84|nr:aspartate/glutamate racemase family protein [Kineococcus indalonis]NAZ86391.1 Asp/Glu/hydantoin racemase [Kineococcus indalonis]
MSTHGTTVLVVNVNTTGAVTEVIRRSALAAAAPGTEVVALTPRFGPASVESNVESHLSAVGVLDAVLTHDGRYDAVVHAGFGEVGREALQDVLDVPVVDITEAAAHTACLLGRTYGVVTSLDRTAPAIRDRLLLAGLERRCSGVRSVDLPVLELEADPEVTAKAFVAQAQRCVEEDGAEVVVLGCAGMAGLHGAVRDALAVPVVDGVAAAVRLAESLVALGLGTSKVRSYAAPRAKEVRGWPWPAAAARDAGGRSGGAVPGAGGRP